MASGTPSLSLLQAGGVSVALAAGFVAVCYALPASVRALPHNHPTHVRRRPVPGNQFPHAWPHCPPAPRRPGVRTHTDSHCVQCSCDCCHCCACCACAVPCLLCASPQPRLPASQPSSLPPWTAIGLHGHILAHVLACATALALICLLFAGSVLHACVEGFSIAGSMTPAGNAAVALRIAAHKVLPLEQASDPLSRHLPIRAVVCAPLVEEVVFRGLLAAWLHSAGCSAALAILLGPLAFAVAHLHHLWKLLREGRALASAILTCMVQLAYTWVFGGIAWVLLLRTGSLPAAVAAHALCNCFGLPSLDFLRVTDPGYRARFCA